MLGQLILNNNLTPLQLYLYFIVIGILIVVALIALLLRKPSRSS